MCMHTVLHAEGVRLTRVQMPMPAPQIPPGKETLSTVHAVVFGGVLSPTSVLAPMLRPTVSGTGCG